MKSLILVFLIVSATNLFAATTSTTSTKSFDFNSLVKFGANDRISLSDFGNTATVGSSLIIAYGKEINSNQLISAYTSAGTTLGDIKGIDYKYFYKQNSTIRNSWYGNALIENNNGVKVENVISTTLGVMVGRQWIMDRQLAITLDGGLRHNDIAKTDGVVGFDLSYLF